MPELKARILLWGIDGAGKSTTLQTIHAKLREDLRGEIEYVPTPLDPTIVSEALMIQLGQAGGQDNQIELIAVPGSPDQAMSRKHLLDGVDGLVLIFDASPERIEANAASLEELRASLSDYGRRLEDIPVVLQYNKRDVADPFAIEDLHRRLGLDQSAVFETIATTGHGILAALTTISKHVVRVRRGHGESGRAETGTTADGLAAALDVSAAAEPAPDAAAPAPEWAPPADLNESPAKPELGQQLSVVSVGAAGLAADGSIALPLVVGDEHGQTRSLRLSIRLDSLLDDGPG